MDIYVATQITKIGCNARLISLGAITSDGREYYAELPVNRSQCSDFVLQRVIPQLDGEPALVTPEQLRVGFAEWLRTLQPGVRILTEYAIDRLVLRQLFSGPVTDHQASLEVAPGCMITMRYVPPLGPQAYFNFLHAKAAHYSSDPREHHALVDARALRAGTLAASTARRGSTLYNASSRTLRDGDDGFRAELFAARAVCG